MNPNPPRPMPNRPKFPIPMNYKEDSRPQRGFWAPGSYLNKCVLCECGFIGDKRAQLCADCAYAKEDPTPTGAETLLPCPCCNNQDPQIIRGQMDYTIHCNDCLLEIRRDDLKDAISAWNRRTPPLAAEKPVEYHNPDNLPSPGEPPWRFLVKGERIALDDEWYGSISKEWHQDVLTGFIPGEQTTYRTRRPLPEAAGETPNEVDMLCSRHHEEHEIYTLARKLLAERNAAKEKAKQTAKDFETAFRLVRQENETLRSDRDAARKVLEEAKELLLEWDEDLSDEPSVSEGGSHATDELRRRIAALAATGEGR